ncbi:MAG: flagellar hook-associated protein FlgK [Gemmatimonadetes bacterium]|nr:flagellar hook-associated protein FlgK [Gemmatimonadota bacterium]
MSLNNILGIARSALVTQQAAVQVTSQNISNAATEGYSRQRVALSSNDAVRAAGGFLGTGVHMDDVQRVRDSLLDDAARREGGNASGRALRRDLLGEVEGVFGDVDSAPISGAMEDFWASWSDLANHPSTGSMRTLVRDRGERLGTAINDALTALDGTAKSAQAHLTAAVDDVNSLADQVARLNGEIQTAELGGTTAGDLRDTRDRLLDQLSNRVGTQVVNRSDHTLAVVVSGVTLVDGNTARKLEVRSSGGTLSVGVPGSSTTLRDPGGDIGAALDVANVEVPRVQAELRTFAENLVTEVNAAHQSGTGRDFFSVDASGRVSLSADVSDPAVIGVTPSGQGDNRVSLAMAALRDKQVPGLGGKTFGDAHAEIVVGVGQRLSAADADATVSDTLARQSDARRSAVSGVSSDEELIQLMRYQQAYMAATKLVNSVDEMMQSVLQMGA